MQQYIKKNLVEAQEYTKEMKKYFISLGKNPKLNPVPVTINEIPKAKFSWNWHNHNLEIDTDDMPVVIVPVGHYIILDDGVYCVMSPKDFNKKYKKCSSGWLYKSNGYTIIDIDLKMKDPCSGKWVDAVEYIDKDGIKYIMESADFFQKFTPLPNIKRIK